MSPLWLSACWSSVCCVEHLERPLRPSYLRYLSCLEEQSLMCDKCLKASNTEYTCMTGLRSPLSCENVPVCRYSLGQAMSQLKWSYLPHWSMKKSAHMYRKNKPMRRRIKDQSGKASSPAHRQHVSSLYEKFLSHNIFS